jgi:hypothetical protein
MKTITVFDPNTGILGPILSFDGPVRGPFDSDQKPLFLEGAFDIKTQMLDLATMEIINRPPPLPLLNELQTKRNSLLDNYRWTIMPDSPLSETNKEAWLNWLKSLQALLIGVTPETTDSVVWPEKPPYEYA